jgi:DNA-directed RNA polymerase II subunit RPB2
MSKSSKKSSKNNDLSDLRDNLVSQKRLGGDDNNLSTDDLFRLLDLYFHKEFYAYRHLHNSFDKFIENTLITFFKDAQHVFTEVETESKFIKHKFEFDNFVIEPPKHGNGKDPMFPSDARKLGLTYSSTLYADITQYKEIIDQNSSGNNVKRIKVGNTEHKRAIVNIPTMIKSKYCNINVYKSDAKNECKYDPGGYFIINGSEKIVISQDRMIHNHPMVYVKKNSNIAYNVVQVNSRSEKPNTMPQTITVRMKKDNQMIIKIPILHEINPMIIFRAMGIESDKDIVDMIVGDENDKGKIDLVRYSLDACVNDLLESKPAIRTKEEAIDYLVTKLKINKKYIETDPEKKMIEKKHHLMIALEGSLFPHINPSSINKFKKKAFYLGYIINKLLNVELGRVSIDNRDSYTKKRVDNINELFEEIFINTYKNLMKDCDKRFTDRMGDNLDSPDVYNIIYLFKAGSFEQSFKSALMLGTWPRRKGVSQMLDRISYFQLIAYLSRVDSQGGQSSSKITKPRQLEVSSIPFLCGVQTPEHAKVGLIKHLSLLGSITIGTNENTVLVKEFILEHKSFIDLLDLQTSEIKYVYKIFLNGEWLGVITNKHKEESKYSENPVTDFYADAKYKKITGMFDPEMTSVVLDHKNKEIRFNTDSGRLYRPVLRVNGDNELILTKKMVNKISLKKGKGIIDFDDFYSQNPYPIEYIDTEEQPYMMVASKLDKLDVDRRKILKSDGYIFKGEESKTINRYDDKFFVRYDYCEIHPSVLLGEIVSNIPFANRNQAPRDIFQYAQGKQGMTIYATNYRSRVDISHVLYTPEVPLVNSRTAKYTYADSLPPGANAIVAISTYGGYNQEDSLIFNKTSIDRGLFRSMTLKKFEASITKNQETSGDDKFMNPPPDKTIAMKNGDYSKLNEKGFAPEETKLKKGDIIFGKVTPITESIDVGKNLKDSSVQYKAVADGTIDRVYTGIKNQDGYEMRKALVRSDKIPTIGDKFCCYTPDTKILTTSGWIRFDELTDKHKVATLIDGDTLEYQIPSEVMSYDYDGDLYVIDTNQVKLSVTPNHRMWVRPKEKNKAFKIEKAEDIKGKIKKYQKNVDKYIPNKSKSFTKNRKIKIGKDSYDLEPFLTFLGIWIAEGSLHKVAVIFAAHKERVKQALLNISEDMDFKINKHLDKGERDNWYIPSKTLTNFLRPYSVGAVNKFLPEFVWDLTPSECNYLIDGMMLGDGHTMKNGTRRYDTSSRQLAEDFQRLCLHAGHSTNITLKYKAGHTTIIKTGDRKGEKITSTSDAWRMTINTKQNNPIVNKTKKQDYYEKYKGKVYCCTVKGDGVIYVSKNDCPVWCGNSRHGQKGTLGISLPNVDMPHTKYGLRPDIIMNPCAVPSRMTVGQLVECLFGKVGAIKGRNVDGTAFEPYDIESMKNELESLGYEKNSEEYLYNGMTGRMMKTAIFIGPTYYQRLKHMTSDKIHCLDNKHEVLTINGWKNIVDITLQDKVAVLKDNELVYEKPLEVLHYPEHEGMMYYIQTNNVDLAMTENHRVFVSDDNINFELRYANEISGKVYYKSNNDKTIIIDHNNIKKIYEKKPVYCLRVSSEVFYVRRNGKSIWTGNSRARGPSTTLTRQAPDGRSNLGLCLT